MKNELNVKKMKVKKKHFNFVKIKKKFFQFQEFILIPKSFKK